MSLFPFSISDKNELERPVASATPARESLRSSRRSRSRAASSCEATRRSSSCRVSDAQRRAPYSSRLDPKSALLNTGPLTTRLHEGARRHRLRALFPARTGSRGRRVTDERDLDRDLPVGVGDRAGGLRSAP